MDTVLWLCPSLSTETLIWLSSLPILMQESFWWWQCSDRYIISPSPHLHIPFPPFSPSLISLRVSVDVKHHVYLHDHERLHWPHFHPFASNSRLFGGNVIQVNNKILICFVKQTTQVPFCKTESTKLCHIASLIFPTASCSKAWFRYGLLRLNNKTGCTPYHSRESLAMEVTHSGSMLVYNTIIMITDYLWCPIL